MGRKGKRQMKIKEMAQKLRLILYKNYDCETLRSEFERVMTSYNCEYELNIIENDKAIIVDVTPYIQFTRKKGNSYKIYESIADSSSLK